MTDFLPDFPPDLLSTRTFPTSEPAIDTSLVPDDQQAPYVGRGAQVPSTVDQMVDPGEDPSLPPKPVADPEDPTQFRQTRDAVTPPVRKDPPASFGKTLSDYDRELSKSFNRGALSTAITVGLGLGATMAEIEKNLPQKNVDEALSNVLDFAIKEKDPAKRNENLKNLRTAVPLLFPNRVDAQNAQMLISDAFESPEGYKILKEEIGKQFDPFNDTGFKALFATQKWADDTFKPAADFANTWPDKIAGGFGSTLTFLAATYFGGSTAGFTIGALSGQGQQFQDALLKGAPPDLALKAAMLGTIPGATEYLPIEMLLRRPTMTNVLFNVLATVGRQAVLEGGQEALQQVMQNAIAQYLYKPDQLLTEGVKDSAIIGGVVGGAMGGSVDLLELRGHYYDEKVIKHLNKEWERQKKAGATQFDPGPIPGPAVGTPADPNANPLPPSLRGLEPKPAPPAPEKPEPGKPAPAQPLPQETAPGQPAPPQPRLSDVAPGTPLYPENGPTRAEVVSGVQQQLAGQTDQVPSAEALQAYNSIPKDLRDVLQQEAQPPLTGERQANPRLAEATAAMNAAIDRVLVSREASAMAQTPPFKAWFAGSKVVDEQGKPKIYYHATDGNFGIFRDTNDIGFHFGTIDQANLRAQHISGIVGGLSPPLNVMPVFLNIKNPFRMRDMGTWDPEEILDQFVREKIITREQADADPVVDREFVRDALAAKGYDGIVYLNRGESDLADQDVSAWGERHFREHGAEDSYIAFEPTQIKSIFNEGTYDPRDPDISKLSVPLRTGEETLAPYGVNPGDKVKVREIAAALEARQREQFGKIEFGDHSPAAKEKLVEWLSTEVGFELQPSNIDKSAFGWYTDKFQRALDTFGQKYPELTDDAQARSLGNVTRFRSRQDARDLMTAILAITSDGQKVSQNFTSADNVYAAYRQEGRMPATVEGGRGERSASMTKNLLRMQKLIDDLGIEGMTRYLLTERTVADMNKELRALGRGEEVSSKLPAGATMPQAAVEFGPKLGAFYANLMGTQGYLTMDMWWARTFNRMRGTLLKKPSETGMKRVGEMVMQQQGLKKPPSRKKLLEIITQQAEAYKAKGYKNGTELEKASNTLFKDAFINLEESPLGASDRAFMIDVAKETQKRLAKQGHDLTIADIQALIWYYEKRLYGELGAKQSDDISYEEAAQRAIAGQDLRQPGSAADGAREADAGRAPPVTAAPRSIGERLARVRRALTQIVDRGSAKGTGGKVWDNGGGRLLAGERSDLTFRPTPAAAAILQAQGVPIKPIIEHSAAEFAPDFHKAISAVKAASKHGAAVYVYPVDEYAQMRLFTTEDNRSGFAIKSDGDIVSVFSDGGGIGPMMMQLAVEQGGTKLDAFDTVLPEIYSSVGFVEVGRQPWNEEYKPDDWDYRDFAQFNEGRPDVVFMEYRPTPADRVSKSLVPQAPRGAHALERVRPPGGIAEAGQGQSMTKQEIKQQFTKALNLTVEQGRFGRGNADAAAIYKWGQSVARISDPGDLTALFHEGAHHIHSMMGQLLDDIITRHINEIHNVADKYYGGGGQIKTSDTKLMNEEGFATWFQIWMNNTAEAGVIAPGFKQSFEALLNSKSPDLSATMRQIQEGVDKLVTEKPSIDLLRERIKPLKGVTTVGQIRNSVKEGTFLHDIGTLANRLYQMGFDKDHPLTVTMLRLKSIAEANVRRLMDQGALDRAGAERVLAQLDKRGRANPIAMMWMAKNSHNISSEIMATGVPEWNGNGDPVTLGIPAILAIAQGSAAKRLDPVVYADLNAYAAGRRIVQEWDNYNETRKWHAATERGVKYPEPRTKRYRPPDDMKLDDAIKAVTELHNKYPNFEKAVQELYKFQNALLKWRFDAGDLTKEQFDYMSGMQNYVPLRRDMGEEERIGAIGKTKDQRTGKDDLIRVFKGSSRPIISPIEAIMQAVEEQVALTLHNQVKRALVDIALDVGMNSGAVVEKIPATSMKGTNVKLSEVLKAAGDFQLAEEIANAMGRDEISMQEFLDEFIDGDETATIWRQQDLREKGEKIIYVRRNGNIEAYKLNDPEWGAELYNTLTELGQEQTNTLIRILGKPAAVLRAGVTTAPPYMIANIIRDQLSAWILNDGVFPGLAIGRGIKNDLLDRKARRLYNLSGAAIGASNIAALDKTRIGTEQTRLAKLGIGVTMEASLEKAARLMDSSETWTRQGIWYAAYKKAKADGLSDPDAMAEAGFESSDYVNYGRAGSKMLTVRRLITFLNANLQGLDKSFRTALGGQGGAAWLRKEMLPWARRTFNLAGSRTSLPLTPGEKLAVQRGLRTVSKMMSLAIISAVLGALYWDDEEYDTMSPYLKGTRWMVKLAPGQWLAIPKPFQLALFATMTEYAIDGVLKDDPTALMNFLKSQAAVIVPPFENPVIKLLYETRTNTDLFTGRPIVDPTVAGMAGWLQYNQYTSELGKALGRLTGVSPMLIDHYITSSFATWGRAALSLSNYTNPNRPSQGWDDLAFTSYFLKNGARSSTVRPAFWDLMAMQGGRLTGAAQGYKKLMDAGAQGQAQEYLSHLDEDSRIFAQLYYGQKPDGRKLHPLRNASDAAGVFSEIRKEITLGQFKADKGKGELIVLSPTKQKLLNDRLGELSVREMRNALVIMDAPGWGQREVLPTMPIFEQIKQIDPATAIEIKKRMAGKVYAFDVVRQQWPSVRSEVLLNGDDANLRPQINRAKVYGNKFFTDGAQQ